MLAAVSVAVTAANPVTLTVAGMAQVTGLVALAGEAMTVQVRSMVPVNPLAGMMLTVDVLLVVAPTPSVMLPLLLREKPGTVELRAARMPTV